MRSVLALQGASTAWGAYLNARQGSGRLMDGAVRISSKSPSSVTFSSVCPMTWTETEGAAFAI